MVRVAAYKSEDDEESKKGSILADDANCNLSYVDRMLVEFPVRRRGGCGDGRCMYSKQVIVCLGVFSMKVRKARI